MLKLNILRLEPVNHNSPLEIWGGVECTVVRVKGQVHDQLKMNGHEKRPDDLKLFTDLGIKTIRFPILWEKAWDDFVQFFNLVDQRLYKLQELGITPIAGLLHHGSGPENTDPLDPGFPDRLADYAYRIAKRYPWVKYYTPINEPLTTARFSGLYGIWHPHKRDDHSFLKIFLNEIKGIILSMRAIKSVNSNAQLIQTEDLSKTHSTEHLRYQAEFENHRRWLTYDLLTNKFGSDHPLWNYFVNSGINEKELEFFSSNDSVPSICGFNYYITSERYLDHRKNQYPECHHGGNGIEEYADLEASRLGPDVYTGLRGLLKEAWQRFNLPMALTEIHLAGTREEQLRWFYEAYATGKQLKNEGFDFRAITAWSFLGSFDWNSLLQKKGTCYESGVYDIRSGKPRATALAGMIKKLNNAKEYCSSLLEVPGWWRRQIGWIYSSKEDNDLKYEQGKNHITPLLIVGANGSLGKAFAKICHTRGIVQYLADRSQLDITSEASVNNILQSQKPWAVINAAGFSKIDEAEKDPRLCFHENTYGAYVLAKACKAAGIKLVTFSTDQVFNGKKKNPYVESDTTHPINIYGQSKKMAEEKILLTNPETLIIRCSSFYNPWYEDDFLRHILYSGMHNLNNFYLASDIIISPTYIPDLVNAALDLLIDNESGIWHLSNKEEISYFDFTKLALNIAGVSDRHIFPVPSVKLKYPAKRPKYSVLMNSSGISLSPLQNALSSYLKELSLNWNHPELQRTY